MTKQTLLNLRAPIWLFDVYNGRARKVVSAYGYGRIWNLSQGNSGRPSLYGFLRELSELKEFRTRIHPGKMAAQKSPYPRFHYSVLGSDRLSE